MQKTMLGVYNANKNGVVFLFGWKWNGKKMAGA